MRHLYSTVADPDPHQSGKVEALEVHCGALEGPNLEKVSGLIRIRIREKVRILIGIHIRIKVKSRIRTRIKMMRIRNTALQW
jgi:hypothetical protein